MSGRVRAVLMLAWALVTTLVRRLFGRGRRGVSAFQRNYAADGLSSLTAEQREEMRSFGGCIACGLCDRGEAERMERSAGAYPGVMELVLASARSMPDYAAAAVGFGYLPDEVLLEKEGICPANVPIGRIARFVKSKAGQARTSHPST